MCNMFTLEKIRWVESTFFENVCRVFAYLPWAVVTGAEKRARGKKTAHGIQAVSGSECNVTLDSFQE
jgi:hypothetical protein